MKHLLKIIKNILKFLNQYQPPIITDERGEIIIHCIKPYPTARM
jgi:hypothetical protein